MSLRPARRPRKLGKDYTPAPYDVQGVPDAPTPDLVGRVRDTRPCEKCGYDLLGQRLDGVCPECGKRIMGTPQQAAASTPARFIQRGIVVGEKSCTGCGYNLKGLPIKHVCPECGKPILFSVRPSRTGGSITDASGSWLRVLAFGCVIASIGGCALLLSMVTWAALGGRLGGLATIASGLVWWLGVVIVTRPRPPLPGVEADAPREWFWSRLLARVSQAFWIPRGIVIMLGPTGALSPVVLYTWSITTALFAGLGLAAVFYYITHLADWAGDETLQRRARACVALGPFAVFWGVVSVANGWGGFMVPLPTLLWGGALYFTLIVLPMFYIAMCLFTLGQFGPWALTNHLHEQARLDRLRGRAAEDLAAADAHRKRGVVQDTAQPDGVLMPGPASRAAGPEKPGQSIRHATRRPR